MEFGMPETGSEPVNLFIVSKSGAGPRHRVLWTVTQADALKICADPSTSGRNFGIHREAWATAGERGENRPRGGGAWFYCTDNGRYAPLFERLGVTVLGCETSPYDPEGP
jgi:hypothetical protein